MDLRPSGLSPAAILVIRRLADPDPGRLGADRAGASQTLDWERSVRSRIASLAASAVRAADGAIPANADAVVFRDRAELIACFLEDRVRGDGRAWWWRYVDVGAPGDRLTLALLGAPREVPGALGILRDRGSLVEVLEHLAPDEARSIAAATAMQHGFATLARVIDASSRDAPGSAVPRPVGRVRCATARSGRGEPSGPRPAYSRSSPARAARSLQPPWAAALPHLPALSPERQLLAGIALQIRDAPAAASSAGFAARVAAWLEDVAVRSVDAMPAAQPGTGWPASTAPQEPPAHSDLPVTAQVPGTSPSSARPRSRTAGASRRKHAHPQDPARAVEGGQGPNPGIDRGTAFAGDLAVPNASAAEGADPVEITVSTRWAGTFYLLNVALALGLYGDFAHPAATGIRLDPWTFQALIAHRLGAAPDDDPLWRLLERLAGGPRGVAGPPGFRPFGDWRIDPGWLVPFRSDRRRWRWLADPGRLLVEHPAGFTVVDIATDQATSSEEVRRVLDAYPGHSGLIHGRHRPRRISSARERWLDHVSAYIRVRLGLAIGPGAARDPVAAALRSAAVVDVTPTRVDVTFSLDALPIAIRIAGLDRDPGWIPAARRDVRFHFA
jgi:hypothetical protein